MARRQFGPRRRDYRETQKKPEISWTDERLTTAMSGAIAASGMGMQPMANLPAQHRIANTAVGPDGSADHQRQEKEGFRKNG
jgi:hypothetical protein